MDLPRTYLLAYILISFSVSGEIACFMECIGLWTLLGKSSDDIRGKCILASPVLFNFCYFKVSLLFVIQGKSNTLLLHLHLIQILRIRERKS